jgi:hypothetical protein
MRLADGEDSSYSLTMFKLVREATPENLAYADRHHWPIRITATYSEDDSAAKIFVMQTAAPGGYAGDTFSCVASIQQMEDLPEDAVGPTSPYYRVNQVTVYCRTPEAAIEFSLKVEAATQDLADNIASANILAVEDVTIIIPNVNVS